MRNARLRVEVVGIIGLFAALTLLVLAFSGCAVMEGIGRGFAAPSSQRAVERLQPRPAVVCTHGGIQTVCQ